MVSLYNTNTIHRGRLRSRNDKFSRFLKKRPRREISSFSRTSDLTQIMLKENSQGNPISVHQDNTFRQNKDLFSFGNTAINKDFDMMDLEPCLKVRLSESTPFLKKILCHKLKKRHRHSMRRPNQSKSVGSVSSLIQKSLQLSTTLKKSYPKNINEVKNIPSLTLDSCIPDLDLDRNDNNVIDINDQFNSKAFEHSQIMNTITEHVVIIPVKKSRAEYQNRSIFKFLKSHKRS